MDQTLVDECNRLIQVINTGVASLGHSAKPGDADGIADLKSMADSMDQVAGDAAKVELTIPELKKYSADYQAMAKEVSHAARDMAAAADARDMQKITTSQRGLEAAVKKEDPLVDGINKFCQAP